MNRKIRHLIQRIRQIHFLPERPGSSVAFLLLSLLMISGCATQHSGRVKSGVADSVMVESENQDTRVRLIVIHHTTGDFHDSFQVLTKKTDRPVSSHYLIPEPGDPSYPEKDLKLYALVSEEKRAWHAGSSYWAGKTSLNDMSVGIELVNQTYCRNSEQDIPPEQEDQEPARICFYPDFDDTQLAILADLLKGILERHPDVKPTDIVGHADITPQRKIDPGPRFPWQRLYRLGYGAWYDDDTVFKYWEQFRLQMPSVLTLQTALNHYGYDIELSGENDRQSRNVVRAFQMHFLPWQVSGEFNDQTVAVLYALLEKYRPEALEQLP
jgi:N-acetylmuramoyl-L-alanine amidase